MALTSTSFKITFQVNLKKFLLEDTTNYASQGVTDIDGILKVQVNGQTFYTGNYTTPEITLLPVSLTNNLISIPTDAAGNIITGDYTLTYSAKDTTTSVIVSSVKNFSFTYATPVADLALTVDCLKPLLESTDKTNYLVGGITPTITRTHKIQYPPSTNTATMTATTAVLQTNVFFTIKNSDLQHNSNIKSVLSYTFPDFFVTDEINKDTYNNISCDPILCNSYCCLRAEWNRYLSFRGINDVLAQKHKNNFILMTALSEEIKIAFECGKGGDVSGLAAELLKLGNCNDCSCGDGTPQRVTGLGISTGTSVVAISGIPLTLSTAVAGNITTYTLGLDASFVNKVNNSYNSTVTVGPNLGIATTETPGNKDYLINFTGSLAAIDILSFLIKLTPVSASLKPTITVEAVTLKGSIFQSPTVVTLASTDADWLKGGAVIKISNIGTVNYQTIKPFTSVVRAKTGIIHPEISILKDITTPVPIVWTHFLIILNDPMGNTYTGQNFNFLDTEIVLQCTIIL